MPGKIKIQRQALLLGFSLLFASWLTIGARSIPAITKTLPLMASDQGDYSEVFVIKGIRDLNYQKNTVQIYGDVIKKIANATESSSPNNPFENSSHYRLIGKESHHTKKFETSLDGMTINFRRFPFETINITIALKESKINSQIIANTISSDQGLKVIEIQQDAIASSQGEKNLTLTILQANNARYIKMMIPLLTVLTISIAGLLISPKNYEPRLGLPATSILVLVFLQDRYSDIIPISLEYSTLMDKLYIIAFVVIVAIFMETVATGNKWLHSRSTQTEEVANKLLDSGRRYAIVILYLLAGIGLFI